MGTEGIRGQGHTSHDIPGGSVTKMDNLQAEDFFFSDSRREAISRILQNLFFHGYTAVGKLCSSTLVF